MWFRRFSDCLVLAAQQLALALVDLVGLALVYQKKKLNHNLVYRLDYHIQLVVIH